MLKIIYIYTKISSKYVYIIFVNNYLCNWRQIKKITVLMASQLVIGVLELNEILTS